MSLVPGFAICPICRTTFRFMVPDEHVRSCANRMAGRLVKAANDCRKNLLAGLTDPKTREGLSALLCGETSAIETLVRGLTDDPAEQERVLALFREDAAEMR